MKSIRLSLLVYFLLLVAAALGAASALAYRTASGSLRDKQAANRTLSDTLFEERKREVEERFNTELIAQAWTLADKAELLPMTNVLRLIAREAGHLVEVHDAWSAARRATPTICGEARRSMSEIEKENRRMRSIANPAASIAPAVSRFTWQPPAKRVQTGSARRCTRAKRGAWAATCS